MTLNKLLRPLFAALIAVCCGSAFAQVKVGVIYSATSPTAVGPQDHSGFDARGCVMMTLKDGAWRLVAD